MPCIVGRVRAAAALRFSSSIVLGVGVELLVPLAANHSGAGRAAPWISACGGGCQRVKTPHPRQHARAARVPPGERGNCEPGRMHVRTSSSSWLAAFWPQASWTTWALGASWTLASRHHPAQASTNAHAWGLLDSARTQLRRVSVSAIQGLGTERGAEGGCSTAP
jgi:hypothetical protein